MQARLYLVGNLRYVDLDRIQAEADQLADLIHQVEVVRARRDAAITAAFGAGYPINAIANASRLTPARVSMILGHPHGKVGRPTQSR